MSLSVRLSDGGTCDLMVGSAPWGGAENSDISHRADLLPPVNADFAPDVSCYMSVRYSSPECRKCHEKAPAKGGDGRGGGWRYCVIVVTKMRQTGEISRDLLRLA